MNIPKPQKLVERRVLLRAELLEEMLELAASFEKVDRAAGRLAPIHERDPLDRTRIDGIVDRLLTAGLEQWRRENQ